MVSLAWLAHISENLLNVAYRILDLFEKLGWIANETLE